MSRSGPEVRVRLQADDTLGDREAAILFDELKGQLGDRALTTIVFEGQGLWMAVHRHAGQRIREWHVRSAVGWPP